MGLCGNIDGCTTNVKSQNTYVGSPQTNYFLYLSKKILTPKKVYSLIGYYF